MKKYLAAIIAIIMLLSVCACSAPAETEAPAAVAEQATTTTEAAEPAEDKLKIAYVGCVAASQFYVGMVYGIEDVYAEKDVEFLVTDTYIVQEQLDAINNYISLGVDGMILTPGDPDAIASGIDALDEAGVPVVICDIIPNNKKYVASFASDNYAIGVETAHQLAERLTERYGAPQGKICCMLGSQAITSHYGRWHGFLDTVTEEYPNIEMLAQEGQVTVEDSLNTATNWFTMYAGELDAIWDPTDSSAVAAHQAAKATNSFYEVGDENHCIIVSIDGEPNTVDLIRQNAVDCTVAQNSYDMGKQAAEAIYANITEGAVPEQQDNVVPYMVIDTENCNSDEVAGKCWADIVMARAE